MVGERTGGWGAKRNKKEAGKKKNVERSSLIERERQRRRETETDKERQRQTDRDRETDTERQRQTDRQIGQTDGQRAALGMGLFTAGIA